MGGRKGGEGGGRTWKRDGSVLIWIFVEKESSRTGWNIMIDFNYLSII